MKLIIGKSDSENTAALVNGLIANKNTALLLVPSKASRNALIKAHSEALEANMVNEARVVSVESLKVAMKHFKPEYIIIDKAELLLGKILGLSEEVRVAALSLKNSDLSVEISTPEVMV